MKCGSSSSSLSYISPVLIPKCINKVKENKERIKEKEESFSEGLMKGLYNVLVDVNTSERTLRKCLGAIYTVAHDGLFNLFHYLFIIFCLFVCYLLSLSEYCY